MQEKIHTHYDNLKVARNAPPEVIRASYKVLCQKYHPDKHNGNKDANRVMKIINTSYKVLADPIQRQEHDDWIISEEKINEKSQLKKQKNTLKTENFIMPISGFCQLDDLPQETKNKILQRVHSTDGNQWRTPLEGIRWNYFWLIALCTTWVSFLVTIGNGGFTEKQWPIEVIYIGFFIAIASAFFIARHFIYILNWNNTPLKSFLIITPVYIIKTHLNTIWYWPVWQIKKINSTHNYINGAYTGTTLSINFDQTVEFFSLSSIDIYESFTSHLNLVNNKINALLNDANRYIAENDDFISFIASKNNYNIKSLNNKKIYILAITATLIAFGYAVEENKKLTEPEVVIKKNEKYVPIKEKYTRPSGTPVGYMWPNSSSYLSGYKILNNNGLSTLTVDNTLNSNDVFIKLYYLDGNPYPVRHFYIEKNDVFILNNIRPGMYDVRYQNLSTGALSKSELFFLAEDTEYIPDLDGNMRSSTSYSNMVMTLYKIKDGNMQTYSLSEEDF